MLSPLDIRKTKNPGDEVENRNAKTKTEIETVEMTVSKLKIGIMLLFFSKCSRDLNLPTLVHFLDLLNVGTTKTIDVIVVIN